MGNVLTRHSYERRHRGGRDHLVCGDLCAYIPRLTVPITLRPSRNGLLHSKQTVRIRWVGAGDQRWLAALPALAGVGLAGTFPVLATATEDPRALARTTFYLRRHCGDFNHAPLRFGKAVRICKSDGGASDVLFFGAGPKAPGAGRLEVRWEKERSDNVRWWVLAADPEVRRRTRGQFIPLGEEVVLCHAASRRLLAPEEGAFPTAFGPEKALTCPPRRRKEGSEYRWRIEAC